MEEYVLSIESANSESLSTCELLILHTAEAQEWAMYLRQILNSAPLLSNSSILMYAVDSDDKVHGYNFEYFHSCKCIVLLLTGAFIDILCDPELRWALQRLLCPSHRVVVLLCGVSEHDILKESFEDWMCWRKLSTDDEPAFYVSSVLEAIADSRQAEAEKESEPAATAELHITVTSSIENEVSEESEEQNEPVQRDEEPVSLGNSTNEEMSSPTHINCLTVQPNRVLCGEQEIIFIIFTHKVDEQLVPEVEFSCENVDAKRVPGTVMNEYTISVTAPDMPTGVVSLTMYTDQSCISLQPVTYYTNMGEVSRYLENATDPINFICQAFNLTSNLTESLDNMLTDSLKARMPATGLQLFGIRQIEENNMVTYKRKEDLPTLLHFAAKYGLKKLTTVLLQSPGALQAYSVMNKHGDYPNTLAEKSGFSNLRQFMDDFVETADMLKSHIAESINTEEFVEVYESMSAVSQDIMTKYSGGSEDIYESMVEIDPKCAEDLYEAMNALNENPEEAMLRKFFQAKHQASAVQDSKELIKSEEEEKENEYDFDEIENGEDPYNLCPEDIYYTVDAETTYNPSIMNRPPAPIPRSEHESEPINNISRVFSDKETSRNIVREYPAVQPVVDPPTPTYDPYGGMKTPGQRQLISLQERVKVGEISVDEAVQEFKAWQFDHERRATSIRYQQENLKRLRDSINRRHNERQKSGMDLDYEISAPLQNNLHQGSSLIECAVYEPAPRMVVPHPSLPQSVQRGTWKTGSTSSSSSTESNRLSIHSRLSFSSGTEPEFEDAVENLPPPPRPPRTSDSAPIIPPPRIPPRIPERVADTMLHERYISCPTRALPQRPTQRHANLPPPIPRRLR